MSLYYYDIENKLTKRKYRIEYQSNSYWHCDNENCHEHHSCCKSGEITIVKSKTERINIDKDTYDLITTVTRKKLVDKKFTFKCRCGGTSRFVGYYVGVIDMTEAKTQTIGKIFQSTSGAKKIFKEYRLTKAKRNDLVNYLREYYEKRFIQQ